MSRSATWRVLVSLREMTIIATRTMIRVPLRGSHGEELEGVKKLVGVEVIVQVVSPLGERAPVPHALVPLLLSSSLSIDILVICCALLGSRFLDHSHPLSIHHWSQTLETAFTRYFIFSTHWHWLIVVTFCLSLVHFGSRASCSCVTGNRRGFGWSMGRRTSVQGYV